MVTKNTPSVSTEPLGVFLFDGTSERWRNPSAEFPMDLGLQIARPVDSTTGEYRLVTPPGRTTNVRGAVRTLE
jgi:hypothetical protein